MVPPVRILLIDDDDSFRSILEYNLEQAGYEVVSVSDGKKGLKRLEATSFPVVITDIKMPEVDGLEVLRRVRRQYPETLVIMITAYGSIEMAVEAMREGAYDYITKPLNRDALLMTLEKALQYRLLKEENRRLKQELGERFQVDQIVGASRPMKALVQQLRRVAETDATVLITGETGTGKELVARAIHYHSRRKDDPLVTLNCAAIPRDLLESELFGHAKGAFTGAARERKGKFHAANGGTLFLDEIGNMDVSLQAKLSPTCRVYRRQVDPGGLQRRFQLQNLLEICSGLIQPGQLVLYNAASEIGLKAVGRELDRAGEVTEGLDEAFEFQACKAAVERGIRIGRIQLHCSGKVYDRVVVLAPLVVGQAAVVVRIRPAGIDGNRLRVVSNRAVQVAEFVMREAS